MKTKSVKAAEIQRSWHLIDAQEKILGRLSTEVASLLTGKSKPYFVRHLDCGDYVVVINAAGVKVSGHKAHQKQYHRHSGYPGGFRTITFEQQMEKDPRKIIHHAVAGMLAKNKLRAQRLARLKIFADNKYPYEEKFRIQKDK